MWDEPDARVVPSPSGGVDHRPNRVAFIDALRLLATFQMVQGHTLDAVLATTLRHGRVFELWQSTRGLTAVAFLFVAGVTFQQTTLQGLDAFRVKVGASRRRVLRALRLVALGYLLHVPLALLWTDDTAARAAILGEFLGVDVLQCIGVTLLCFAAVTRSVSSARAIALGSLLAACLMLGLSPLTQELPVTGAWAWLTSYVSTAGASIFPLLPWAGHFALGVAVAQWAQAAWTGRLTAVGVGGVGVAWLLALLGDASGWDVVALHVLRVSTVTLVCAALSWRLSGRGRLPRWVERLAGRTLHVYVFHILLVYGAGVGLAAWLGPRLALGQALLVTAAVLLASAVVGFGGEVLSPAGRARRALGALAAPTRKR